MDFVQAQIELYADEIDLGCLDTGECVAGVVDSRGRLLRVVDSETGETVTLGPEALRTVEGEARRAWEGRLQ